ncbi:MAG: lipopolysaccharide biosynthesis-like protein [Paracoccaceae bacterium]|nr:lipopolysaccharide biosynthesis-like protein [Paracoccaceae bacterium]
MIPTWKAKRELRRLKMQLLQWHWILFGGLLRRLYDRRRARLVKVHDGAQTVRDRIAVTLCFQPRGILPTFLAELDHFVASGFSPVVVSNLPLAPQDRDALLARSLMVIERPNYGYDFGGYREGILCLLERGLRPESLILKNDSVWFPIWPDSDLLARCMADEHDLFGIFLNAHGRKHRQTHLQSYFYRFGGRLVASPEFERYWRGLLMTNNKHAVVRQCETRLTGWFRDRGFSVGQAFDAQAMRAAMRSLGDAELLDVIRYQVRVETRLEKDLRPLIDDPGAPDWRSRIEALIDAGRFRNYHMIAHPHILFGALRSSLLKKDRQLIYQIQRQEIRDRGYDARMLAVFRDEIGGWDGG